MPFLCTKISQGELKEINMYMLSRVPYNKINPHPLFDDVMTSQVLIDASDPTTMVFISHRGLFFERHPEDEDVKTSIRRMFETKTQAGITTPFVVDQDDPTVVDKLLIRFQESYGITMARQIDHYIYFYEGKKLMLVKFSQSVLRFTMAPSGGILKTIYKGPIESLKQIPTLCKFVGSSADLEEGKSAVFATQYSDGSLPIVARIHYDIVREVIAKPNLGICIGPVAVWDA